MLIRYKSGTMPSDVGVSVVHEDGLDCVMFKSPQYFDPPVYIPLDQFFKAVDHVKSQIVPANTVEVAEEWVQHVEARLGNVFDKAIAAHDKATYNSQKIALMTEGESNHATTQDFDALDEDIVEIRDRITSLEKQVEVNNDTRLDVLVKGIRDNAERIQAIEENTNEISNMLIELGKAIHEAHARINTSRKRIIALEDQSKLDHEAHDADTIGLGVVVREIGSLTKQLNHIDQLLVAHENMIGAITNELTEMDGQAEDADTTALGLLVREMGRFHDRLEKVETELKAGQYE